MDTQTLSLTVFLMVAVTYLPRAIPVVFLANAKFPPLLERWLAFVPVSLLATVLTCQIFVQNQKLSFSSSNEYLIPALISVLVAVRTRSLCTTILCGIATLAISRWIWG